jgi:SAM-dependent methyltransferase
MRMLARAFEELVHQHLAGTSARKVLDFGCGPMPYRPLFERVGHEYLGADFADNPLAQVRLDSTGILPCAHSSVDVVVSSQVLEHVVDVPRYLSECRRVLRADGLLLLSTHGSWIYHPHPTDLRRWTRWGLEHEISQAGFTVHDVVPCLGPLAYTTQLRLLLVQGFLRRLGALGVLIGAPLALLCQGLMWIEERVTPAWVSRDNACVYVIAARRS